MILPETGAIETATTGAGKRDHYHGSFGKDRFLHLVKVESKQILSPPY
jgi:hypothetical protein